jgi:hypothetical protein
VWLDALMHDPAQRERYGLWTLCALRAALHRARDVSTGALLTSEEQVSARHHRFRQAQGVFRAGLAPQLRHARLDWDVPYCAPSVGAVRAGDHGRGRRRRRRAPAGVGHDASLTCRQRAATSSRG